MNKILRKKFNGIESLQTQTFEKMSLDLKGGKKFESWQKHLDLGSMDFRMLNQSHERKLSLYQLVVHGRRSVFETIRTILVRLYNLKYDTGHDPSPTLIIYGSVNCIAQKLMKHSISIIPLIFSDSDIQQQLNSSTRITFPTGNWQYLTFAECIIIKGKSSNAS